MSFSDVQETYLPCHRNSLLLRLGCLAPLGLSEGHEDLGFSTGIQVGMLMESSIYVLVLRIGYVVPQLLYRVSFFNCIFSFCLQEFYHIGFPPPLCVLLVSFPQLFVYAG